MAYALDTPNKGKIHDIFHVSWLKKKLGSASHIQTKLPMLDDEGKLVLEPECILEIKTKKLCSRLVNEYPIKWKTLPDDEATWENEYFLLKHLCIPVLHGQSISERDDL